MEAAKDEASGTTGFDKLHENSQNLSRVLDAVFDGVYMVDAHRRIREWSAGAAAQTGFTREEVCHRRCSDNILVHVDEHGTELCLKGCPLQATLSDGQIRQTKVFLRHKQGYRVPISVRTVPMRDADDKIIGAVETFRESGDAEQWKARISELERAAYMDALTEIPNRRFLNTQLERLLREGHYTGECFAVLIIDVDRFKSVNDTLGHDVGDELLRNISRSLANCLRGRDILGRWGGDEFLMLLPATNRQQCLAIAERSCHVVARTSIPTATGYVSGTMSIGGAVSTLNDTANEIIQRADAQLYNCKRGGRNRWSVE